VEFFKKSAKWITTVHCTVCTDHVEWLCGITPAPCQIASTPYHECTQSHQLRTMNDRGYTNSVPWMYAVTLTPYHEWPGSHQLRTMNARSLSTPSSHFHSDQLRTFMVRSWCDRGHSWYEVDVTASIPRATWFLCTLYSGNSFGGFFPSFIMTNAAVNLLCVSVTIL